MIGGCGTGTTLLSAILSSDHCAYLFGQEEQILTRIVETYSCDRRNFEHFGTSFFPDLDSYRTFFQDTIVRFCDEIAQRISPGDILILKQPELSKVFLDAMDLLPDAHFNATVRAPRDQVSSESEVGARRTKVGNRDPISKTRNVASLANADMSYNKRIFRVRNQQQEKPSKVRYEDLVQKVQDVINALQYGFPLNLTFDPSKPRPRLLDIGKISLTANLSRGDIYGAPITVRSVDRYLNDLSIPENQDCRTELSYHME